MLDHFEEEGCSIERGLLVPADLNDIESDILAQIRAQIPDATDIQDPRWVQLAQDSPEVVTAVYDALRDNPHLVSLGQNPKITDQVKSVLDQPVLYHKVPLRIDVPFENKELAFWHQDDFYVGGNARELTVWIPLQDTFAHTGALSVMKGSHANGAIPHVYPIGKKTIPTGIFDAPINIAEMDYGDALFFSSFLVHSSNLNVSDKIRYSIQLRYSSKTAGDHSDTMLGFSDA